MAGPKRALSETTVNKTAPAPAAKAAKTLGTDKENTNTQFYAGLQHDDLKDVCRERGLLCGGSKLKLIE
jgi:hypothetical protein